MKSDPFDIIAKYSKSASSNAPQCEVAEGRIIAIEIESTVLGATIWFAFDDDFDPKDGIPVFYSDELELLKNKSVETLRKIYLTKKTFGPGTRVCQ